MKSVNILLPYGAPEQTPNRIVIHAMGEFIDDGQIISPAWDFLRQHRLSAHVLITPSGVRIRQRKDTQGAHHARGYNTDSLGIEFLVPGIHNYSTFLSAMKTDYLTNKAFKSGVEQVIEWIDTYEIVNIDTHHQLDPDRKVDPGDGFPLDRFLRACYGFS